MTTRALVIPFNGPLIGAGTREGSVSLDQVGIPLGLEMIVARQGCETARDMLALVKESRFPRQVALIEVEAGIDANSADARLALLTAYQRNSETVLSKSHEGARLREEEIVLLRRRVEAQTLTNGHLSAFIETLGYSPQELALEMVPDLDTPFMSGPIQQSLPTVLSDIAGISIFSAATETAKSVRIGIGTKYREIFQTTLDLPAAGGWHDLFFPEGFLAQNFDSVLTLEPLSGKPAFALAQGVANARLSLDGRPGESLAMRIWRNPSPSIHPLRNDRVIDLRTMEGLRGGTLGEEIIVNASGLEHISSLVSFPENTLVQTHPIEGETSNHVIRDVDISRLDCVEAVVELAHPAASTVRFILGLIPEGEDDGMYRSLKSWEAKTAGTKAAFTSVSAKSGTSHRLELPVEGLDRSRRYALVLAAEALEPPHYAWAQWKKLSLHMKEHPHRQTYRFASLAALQQQIEYADGPFAEHEINTQNGFAVLAISDGDQYLQTHPLENRVVAARLNFFAPKGLSKLWIDVSVDHEGASPTEFGLLLTPVLDPASFTDYYASAGLGDADDDRVHFLEGGRYLLKTVVNPLQRKTLNLSLLRPLEQNCHVYLFVKPRGGTQYGWCRWHRMAMTVVAESTSSEISG